MGVPARIFATILKYSPASVQNRLWKWWYQRISKAHNKVDFRFMNYGFVDEEGPVLDLVDEPYRLFIQLYHMLSLIHISEPTRRRGIADGGLGV